MPVATDIGPGQRAAAPLDVPAITRGQESLGRGGLLYVGDCKMATRDTRANIHAGGDYYVYPLSESQLPPVVFAGDLAPVWTGAPAWSLMHRQQQDGTRALIAEGCERAEPVHAAGAGTAHRGLERRVVIRSCQLARAGASDTAPTRGACGRRWRPSWPALGCKACCASGIRRSCGSAQCGAMATGRLEGDVQVTVRLDPTAVRQLGGRLYATTQPPEQRSLQEAGLADRHDYLVERAMGRLNGRPLSLTPMDLERDDHATGLIRLLAIGLWVLTRLEFRVRQGVATAKTTLAGVYVGHPQRTTARPTAERLLKVFQGLTRTIIREGRHRRRHLTPLARVHHRILTLLEFPVDI
jgi:hypothetical protein